MEFVKRLHYKTELENIKFDISQSALTIWRLTATLVVVPHR
jgi:hypothetical protein